MCTEEERRQAEEDDAEALDEGYLLDDVALQEEAAAGDDEARHDTGVGAEADDGQAERFESEAHEPEDDGGACLLKAGDEGMLDGEVAVEPGENDAGAMEGKEGGGGDDDA